MGMIGRRPIKYDQKWLVKHVLHCCYQNEKASAEFALMKVFLDQNTSFAEGGIDLNNEELKV